MMMIVIFVNHPRRCNGIQAQTPRCSSAARQTPDMPASPGDRDAGKVRWGHEVSVGYFPQDHTGEIRKGMTAVEWLHQFDPDAAKQDIHGLLGQRLFSGEEGWRRVKRCQAAKRRGCSSAASCC